MGICRKHLWRWVRCLFAQNKCSEQRFITRSRDMRENDALQPVCKKSFTILRVATIPTRTTLLSWRLRLSWLRSDMRFGRGLMTGRITIWEYGGVRLAKSSSNHGSHLYYHCTWAELQSFSTWLKCFFFPGTPVSSLVKIDSRQHVVWLKGPQCY